MPISEVRRERWICDRCGAQQEFPTEDGREAERMGWLRLDLGQHEGLMAKDEQILCSTDVDKLDLWLCRSGTPASAAYNRDEEGRYETVRKLRDHDRYADDTHQHRELARAYADGPAPWDEA